MSMECFFEDDEDIFEIVSEGGGGWRCVSNNGQNGCEYFRTLEMMRERVNNGDSKNYALHLCCGQKILKMCSTFLE